MIKTVACGFAILLWGTCVASAALINLAPFVLQPNTDDQRFAIFVEGTEQTAGLDFHIQVLDAIGGIKGPKIKDVDILNHPSFGDTIFGAVPNLGEFGVFSITDQLYQVGTLPASGSILANGLLAVVTFDTTGLFNNPAEGHWNLTLLDADSGSTVLNDGTPNAEPIPLTAPNGTVALIPEPATIILLLGLLATLPILAVLRRK